MTRQTSMDKLKLVKHLQKKFPKAPLIEDGNEFGWGKNSILVGAEHNPYADYWQMNNNDTIFGIDKKFYEECEVNGWYPEWNDPGTILLYKS